MLNWLFKTRVADANGLVRSASDLVRDYLLVAVVENADQQTVRRDKANAKSRLL